ncbi:MAG TPA: hypothetical protein PKY72_03425 [Bacilli bacterium]|nr:hypothetical protein [Bacilli bacterium]
MKFRYNIGEHLKKYNLYIIENGMVEMGDNNYLQEIYYQERPRTKKFKKSRGKYE